MNTIAVAPDAALAGLLPGAQFADAYALDIALPKLEARGAAERIMARSPRWVAMLLALRNLVVAPLGLHTRPPSSPAGLGALGIFPVLSQTPDRLVAGFDDSHLDFRVVIDVTRRPERQRITLTTLVLTHNRLGRAYLAAVLPFHRMIVRAMLRQARQA
ncbi:DUF2867 domain-containing protein [Labrys sp. LIt4]|uniref:DUF2867 domain-containing protein n=1 Tax=Labrys okinawensis TaxID=346911 RepID=A0A2S9Q592_9HYPH|nr:MULTISPECIES: DUF2867 domain-containing protein [Labrys]MBP0579161.1 DUF2867 domain-containing protein [Labrys sp. LIt4]PRH84533.1 DUF2867 domain-containing protein [Labrys okinawensis]